MNLSYIRDLDFSSSDKDAENNTEESLSINLIISAKTFSMAPNNVFANVAPRPVTFVQPFLSSNLKIYTGFVCMNLSYF